MFGPVRPNELCVFLYVFSMFFAFPFLFFFNLWPDLNLRLGLYPHNARNLLASSRKGFTGDDMFGGQGWPLFGPPVIFTPTYLQHA